MSDRPLLSRAWWRSLTFRILGALFGNRKGHDTPIPNHPKRVLVLAPVLRGDFIVMSPLISGLRRLFPRTELGVVVTQPGFELAEADPDIDTVLLYRKLPGWFRSVWQVLRYQPDIVVLPKGHPAFTETMVILLAHAPCRVGLSHPNHNMFLSHPVLHRGDLEHRTVTYARLLKPFGADPAEVSRRLHIGRDPNAERKARAFMEERGGTWIALNLSAGAARRRWTLRRWEAVVMAVQTAFPDVKLLALGVGPQLEECQTLAQRYPNVETIRTRSMLEAVAFVSQCRLLITPDTGAVHAAVARQVPVFVLYNGDREVFISFAPTSVEHHCVFAQPGQDVATIPVEAVLEPLIAFIQRVLQS